MPYDDAVLVEVRAPAETPEDLAEQALLVRACSEALDTVTPADELALRLAFGFDVPGELVKTAHISWPRFEIVKDILRLVDYSN
jgi:hypothetical protein